MLDIGAKVSFSRSQMIFNVDLEANLGEYFSDRLFRIRLPVQSSIPDDNENHNRSVNDLYSIKNYLGGSFTFASVVEDFISGSRINMNYNAVTWSKFFLFAGKEYIPFFPNLNPSFSKIAALEYSPEHELSGECVSFSIRRRISSMFSVVASASLASSRGFFWTAGIVAEDKIAGLKSILSFNYQGNYCIGIKKEVGESGISLRVAAVVKGGNTTNFRWRDCFEIGLEM